MLFRKIFGLTSDSESKQIIFNKKQELEKRLNELKTTTCPTLDLSGRAYPCNELAEYVDAAVLNRNITIWNFTGYNFVGGEKEAEVDCFDIVIDALIAAPHVTTLKIEEIHTIQLELLEKVTHLQHIYFHDNKYDGEDITTYSDYKDHHPCSGISPVTLNVIRNNPQLVTISIKNITFEKENEDQFSIFKSLPKLEQLILPGLCVQYVDKFERNIRRDRFTPPSPYHNKTKIVDFFLTHTISLSELLSSHPKLKKVDLSNFDFKMILPTGYKSPEKDDPSFLHDFYLAIIQAALASPSIEDISFSTPNPKHNNAIAAAFEKIQEKPFLSTIKPRLDACGLFARDTKDYNSLKTIVAEYVGAPLIMFKQYRDDLQRKERPAGPGRTF